MPYVSMKSGYVVWLFHLLASRYGTALYPIWLLCVFVLNVKWNKNTNKNHQCNALKAIHCERLRLHVDIERCAKMSDWNKYSQSD